MILLHVLILIKIKRWVTGKMKINFKDLKISTKITIGFTILILFIIVIASIGYYTSYSMDNIASEVIEAENMNTIRLNMRQQEKDFAMRGYNLFGSDKQNAYEQWESTKNQFDKSINTQKLISFSKEDIAVLLRIEEGFKNYKNEFYSFKKEYDLELALQKQLEQKRVELYNTLISLDSIQLAMLKIIVETGDKNKISEEIEESKDITELLQMYSNLIDAEKTFTINQDKASKDKQNVIAKEFKMDIIHLLSGTTYAEFGGEAHMGEEAERKKLSEVMPIVESYNKLFDEYAETVIRLNEEELHMEDTAKNFELSVLEIITEQNKERESISLLSSKLLIGLSIFSIILGILISILIIKSITRPLTNTKRDLLDIAETGNLSKRVKVHGKDEIGEMAVAVNEMLNNVAGPVQELSMRSEKIAQGDLTVDVNISAKGDVVLLVDSFKAMVNNLKEFVGKVSKNAELSATSAEELSASSEEVNASTQQVSSTIQEMAKGGQNLSKLASETKQVVDEVGKAAKQVADSSAKASKGAENSGKASDEGIVAGKKAGQVMGQILSSTETTSKRILELDQKSQDIGKVINVINEISDQTNLLALNAAIEAARAGDAGRGFAVVADEVRKLAEETQKATVTIADMIKSIQAGTKQSVEDMNQSKKTVMEGTKVIEEALQSLEKIASISKDLGNQIQDVSAAAEMASVGIERVQKHTQDVSAVAEESAAASEEVSASMEETSSSMTQVSSSAQNLAKSSDELRQLISKFKVNSNDTKLAIVDLAIGDHKIWCRKVKEMTEGKLTLSEKELTDYHQCRLGKWYYGEGISNYSSNSAFKKLESVHSKVHLLGNEAIKLYNSGKIDESKKKYEEAEAISKEVITYLEELKSTA